MYKKVRGIVLEPRNIIKISCYVSFYFLNELRHTAKSTPNALVGIRRVPTTFKHSFLNKRHLYDFRRVQFASDLNFYAFPSIRGDRRKTDIAI